MKSPAKSAPKAVIAYARAQLGKPYIWGGTGPRGYDCSGLVLRAWQAAGVKLPRTTWGQIHAGTATTRAHLVPGDLVLSYGGGHVGLYIGNGKVIHAPAAAAATRRRARGRRLLRGDFDRPGGGVGGTTSIGRRLLRRR